MSKPAGQYQQTDPVAIGSRIDELSGGELGALERDFALMVRERVVTHRLERLLAGLPGLSDMTLWLD